MTIGLSGDRWAAVGCEALIEAHGSDRLALGWPVTETQGGP
ncbi:hypothetical protein BH18ACT8_BH18ACT8_15710 [soil metagenome]